MKRLAMLAVSGLMAALPSVASARPHFFFGFNFAAPLFAPPVAYVAPPVVCAAPPVLYVAPPVVVAPAPVYSYYTYSYPAYGYYHHYYSYPARAAHGGVTHYYGGYRR
jgi:hypothetical protein